MYNIDKQVIASAIKDLVWMKKEISHLPKEGQKLLNLVLLRVSDVYILLLLVWLDHVHAALPTDRVRNQ